MESPGSRLKKLRQELGISLEEVHKKTKIHLNILKAIEEDSFINLSPVYIKGFLKIYCKYLGVNPQDFISDYKEPRSAVNILDTKEKPASFLKTASIKLTSLKPAIKMRFAFIVILIFLFIITMFNLGKVLSKKHGFLSKKSKLITKTETITSVTSQKNITSGIKLGIRAKEDCWIQLKADGRVVFQNILRKGRFESWQAKDKIELSLGNAGVVDLEVNGRLISRLGRKGQVLKNILITKEGLNIPR